ncbi:MAG: histone deacetylase family protein [Hyphomicrobiaceae bacterium]|nr:histone deacetylase family protein [Hyphomicrobiaceae bacterium]
MPTLLITHPSFVEHDTGPSHPERPDRMRAIDKVLAHEVFSGLKRAEAPLREDVEEAILLAHPKRYLDMVKARRPGPGQPSAHLDGDTVLSPKSWEPALRAVGAGLAAVDAVFDKASGTRNAFCQVRPCGHHAEAERAMGFCIFSNIAIAGLYARHKHGAERIAVVDFDVHHGNGTQDIFWSDKDLYFASTHQMPLYPGTGAPGETGVGNIWNAPLRSGDGGQAFKDAFEARIRPSLVNFKPDIILISAGFDAHEADPLASLRLVENDFLWVTEELAEIAEKTCDGRLVSMLEGGYDLTALARSVGVHVRTLMDAAG